MEVKFERRVEKVDGNPKVYLSGPITGYDIEERKRYFGSIEKGFEMAGFEVVNPLKNGLPKSTAYEEHIKKDIELLLTCDSIAMLPDSDKSKGAMLEQHIADVVGITKIEVSLEIKRL